MEKGKRERGRIRMRGGEEEEIEEELESEEETEEEKEEK